MSAWIFDTIIPWISKEILNASVISAAIAAGTSVLIAFRSMNVAERAMKIGYFQASIKEAASEAYLKPINIFLTSINSELSQLLQTFHSTTNEGGLRAITSMHRRQVNENLQLILSTLQRPGEPYYECFSLTEEHFDYIIYELEELEHFPDIPRAKEKILDIQKRNSSFRAHLIETLQACSHDVIAAKINSQFPPISPLSSIKAMFQRDR